MLTDFSTPSIVYKQAKHYFGPNVEIKPSTRKDKKYMLLNPHTDKWIHFGAQGMEDYTKHKDERRRDAFRRRNHKWSKQDKYTAGYCAYYLLW
jgi:hypothetical protein